MIRMPCAKMLSNNRKVTTLHALPILSTALWFCTPADSISCCSNISINFINKLWLEWKWLSHMCMLTLTCMSKLEPNLFCLEGYTELVPNATFPSLIPRLHPACQCCTLKSRRAWYTKSCYSMVQHHSMVTGFVIPLLKISIASISPRKCAKVCLFN